MIVSKHRLVQTVDGFWQTTLASKDKPDAVFMDSPVGAPFAVGMKAEESENIFTFEGKKHRINQSISGEWQFTLTSLDIPDWLIHTPPGVEVDLRMAPIDYDNPEIDPNEEGKRAVTRAVMLCKDDKFWQYLVEIGERGTDKNAEEAARGFLCRRLGITSRSEIKGNHSARERLEGLIQQYRKWRYG